MDLLTLLVALVILGLVYWAAHQIGKAFGIPPPIMVLVDVILVVVAVLYLLRTFGLSGRLSL